MRKSELEKTYDYWKNHKKGDFNKFLNDIDSHVNVLGNNALSKMLDDIATLVG